MKKYLIAVLFAGLATPAFAAPFFVAQSMTTHKCEVLGQKPDGKSMIQVSTKSYKSKADAKKAMNELTECKV
jgi:hypothetical protein